MLQVEQVLQGRYQLKQKLGQNAGRQTWLAIDLVTQPQVRVIVKVINFTEELQWDALKLFEREAQVLKQLHHPQIPQYCDYFCVEQQSLWFVLVQEYIPGSSLQELLDQGKRFTAEQVNKIAVEVLDILIYLHEFCPPVLHRDIKPHNLIWGENEQIYLVDFGAVQYAISIESSTYTVVGTYGYVPMEQFGGRAVPSSDLYALGATLIHLLTGTAPADLPRQNLQIQFAHLVDSSSSILCWLSHLVAPAVEQRFSTAHLALQALESGTKLHSANETPLLNSSITINNSGQGGLFNQSIVVPEEIQDWNWGAFLLAPFWMISNRVWLGILASIPFIGFLAAIALGVKGNEWAWKSRRWKSIEQFKTHQRRWAIAGIVCSVSFNLIAWNLIVLLLLSILI